MRKIDILRRDYINHWVMPTRPRDEFYFPFEKNILYPKIEKFEGSVFTPIKVRAAEKGAQAQRALVKPDPRKENEYNVLLSCFISALDVLPRHIDIAFDFMWRGFESSIAAKYVTGDNNITERVRRAALELSDDPTARMLTDKFLQIMPVQSWEFVTKELRQSLQPCAGITLQLGMAKRLVYADDAKHKLTPLFSFLCAWRKKYYTVYSDENNRKAAICLRHYFRDASVTMDGNTYHATFLDKSSMLFNGLLYTFRNNRTHVSSMAPFVSSVASLKTYMHCHFAFLVAYFGFLYAGLLHRGISLVKIRENVNENLDNFKNFYAGLVNR